MTLRQAQGKLFSLVWLDFARYDTDVLVKKGILAADKRLETARALLVEYLQEEYPTESR